jgi:competence protein ComEA
MDAPGYPAVQPMSLKEYVFAYRIPLLFGVVSLVCIAFSIILLVKSTQTVVPIRFESASGVGSPASSAANFKAILVDIEGAVAAPGVVSLLPGSRVEDAIMAAGGLKTTADTEYIAKNINRAMKVTDGMKIYIPEAGEDQTSHNPGTVVATPGTSSQNGVLISVNMATMAQLDSLPGVGPVTAQKIIDSRPYASPEDLVVKKAIGPALLEKLKNQLSL